MLTELWESDAFTEKKESIIDTIDTEYHWNKGDTLSFQRGGRHQRYRVLHVQVTIDDDGLQREVLLLKI